MTGLEIAALVAAIAGAAMQYQASSEAESRTQQAIARSLDSQDKLQKEAEAKALAAAEKFNPKDRLAEQAQLAEEITANLSAPVSESQAIRSEQQTTQGNVSDDYTTAKAKSDLNSIKSAEALARLLGKSTSANRLRMNEGIRIMDAGQAIDQLHNFSQGQRNADALAIQQASLIDPTKQFAGSVLTSLGTAGLMSGAGSAGNVTEAGTAAKYGTDVGSQQTATLFAQDAAMAGGNSGWFSPNWLSGIKSAMNKKVI